MENIIDQINALEERMYKSEYRIYNAQQELISNLEKIKDQYSKQLMKRSRPSIGKISTTNSGNFERTTPKRLSK